MQIMVFSGPLADQDAEFNNWYDEVHIPDMLAIPGVVSCTRRRLRPTGRQQSDPPYLAVYQIDGDVDTVLKEIGARSRDGRFRLSSAVDPTTVRMTVWEPMA